MTSNFASLLWPGLEAIFGDSYKAQELTHRRLFKVKKSMKSYERVQGITGLGLAQIKNEGASVAYDRMLEGFLKEYVNVTYALGASVSREAYEDDQYDKINKQPKHIARSIAETQEVVAFNVLNNSFSTEKTADGVSIMNSTHPLVGGGTASNMLDTPADLAQTSLQDLLTNIGLAVDDRGKRIKLMPKKLIIAPQNQWTAQELIKSDLSVQTVTNGGTGITNTNALNTLKGVLEVHMSPYLTDPDAFWVMTDAEEGLTYCERAPVRFEQDNEFNTFAMNFIGSVRFAVGATDWRCLFGTAGA